MPSNRPLQVDRDAVSNLQAMFPGTTPQAAEEALRNSNNDVNRGALRRMNLHPGAWACTIQSGLTLLWT